MSQTSFPISDVSLEKVAEPGFLAPHSGRVIILEDHPVALFNIDGEYYAMDNTCPHRGGSLGNGEIDGDVVTCPWHGWEFNCRTGEAVENREIKVQTYRVSVEDDGIYIEWPGG